MKKHPFLELWRYCGNRQSENPRLLWSPYPGLSQEGDSRGPESLMATTAQGAWTALSVSKSRTKG